MNAAMKRVGTLVAAFAVLVALAGCSANATSAGGQSAPTQAPTESATLAPTPAPTAAVDVPTTNAGLDNQRPLPVEPVRLRIDSLNIDMPVQPVGLAADGAMELPEDPADAAWYRFGAWPASGQGSTVIAAHVDSLKYEIGPMARLPEATAGTEIIVTTADGAETVYVVADEGMVVKQDVPWESVFDRAGESRLTLVTCGGEFDYERRTYLSNVIVTAFPRQ